MFRRFFPEERTAGINSRYDARASMQFHRGEPRGIGVIVRM